MVNERNLSRLSGILLLCSDNRMTPTLAMYITSRISELSWQPLRSLILNRQMDRPEKVMYSRGTLSGRQVKRGEDAVGGPLWSPVRCLHPSPSLKGIVRSPCTN